MDEPILVDPEVAKARTLPAAFYRDAELYRRILESAFVPSWQFVGDSGPVKTPGFAWPFTLLEGSLDEPLVFVRDRDDQLRCMSNVCTHRGNLVVEGAGPAAHLRCRYHGRRFGLDGMMTAMPEFEGVEGFPCPSDNLPGVAYADWRGFLFASLAPSRAFASFIHEVERRVGWLPLEEFVPAPARARDYLVKAHWALYVDNYLEGFHIPYVHASLAQTLDYGEYTTELFGGGNVQLGVAQPGEDAFDLPKGHMDAGRRIGAWYFWLFPNLMLNFYPWGLSVNIVRPLSPSLTKVSFIPFVWREDRLGLGAGAALDRVEREDEAVVESVQQGVRSRLYRAGRFSIAREAGVHQFHRLLSLASS